MKIGIFSDVHYCKSPPQGQIQKTLPTLQKLKKAMTAFQKQHVELCFCMGNLVDQKYRDRAQALECFHEAMELIRSFEIPFYLCPGPHEYLSVSAQDLLEQEELYTSPYTVFTEAALFILLDGNFHSDLRRVEKNDFERSDFSLPPQQLEYLKKRLQMSTKSVVLIHQNLDDLVPSKYAMQNAAEIRKIVKNSKRVELVLEGCYPKGADVTIDGVRYLSVPSMLENETDFYRILDI